MEGVAEISLPAWLERLDSIDRDITLAINAWHNPATDALWQFMSQVRIWYAMYLLIIVFFFIRLGWKRALVVTVSCILFVAASDQFANLVKHTVCRLRPMEDADMLARGLHVLEGYGGLYGFFSAHAANCLGFAVCTTKGFRNDSRSRYRGYALFIFIWALMVGVSRVFVGKHYAGDVLVGFIVGTLLGWAFAKLAQLCIKRFIR